MQSMFEKDTPIDLITLADQLRKNGWLEAVGSEPFLSEIVENVATAANIEYHARILVEKATLRSLISVASEVTTECFDAGQAAQEVLDRAEAKVFGISESRIKGKFDSVRDLLHVTFKDIERYGQEGYTQGVRTGFEKLDELLGGMQKSDLVIVGARPSMGKTAFCLSIALNATVRCKTPNRIAIFSLEMSKKQIVERMLCSEARISSHALRSNQLPKRDYQKLGLAAGPLSEAPIYIDDTPGITALELRAKARRLKAQQGLDLIIIDYLQLMSASMPGENRQQEISYISRSLKGIAKELDVPVMALSQLSRASEMRGGDRLPQLSDLRESGAIEQDADVVMFVHRPEYYNRDDESLRGLAEIIVAKQRNGPTGAAKMAFVRDFARFENMAEMAGGGDIGF